MICIGMNYHHTRIANRSWKRRREKEILRIVTGAVAYAFVARAFPNTEAQFDCVLNTDMTSIRLFVDGMDENLAKRVVNYLGNNKNVDAAVLTKPEPCGTM
jgi:hypothetical protein